MPNYPLQRDERGVWVSVSAIMIVAIMALSTYFYVTQQVPQMQRKAEREFSEDVAATMGDLQQQLAEMKPGERVTISMPSSPPTSRYSMSMATITPTLPQVTLGAGPGSSVQISSAGRGSAIEVITHDLRREFEGGTLGENVYIINDPDDPNYGALTLENEWWGNAFVTRTHRAWAFSEMSGYDSKLAARFVAQRTENVENAYVYVYVYATDYPRLKVTYDDGDYQYFYATSDTFVDNDDYEDERNTNYGMDDQLKVGWHQYHKYRQQALLRFDLSRIPAGKTIDNVQLVLACDDAYVEETDPDPTTIGVYEYSDDSWDEDEVTWVSYNDAAIGSLLDEEEVDSGYEDYYWDVTTFVNTERSGDGIASLLMKYTGDPGSLDNDVWAYFMSREFLAVQVWIAEDDDGLPGNVVSGSNQPVARFADGEIWSNWDESGWVKAENLNAHLEKDNVYHLVVMPFAAYNYPNVYQYFSVGFLQPRNRYWVDNGTTNENRSVAYYGTLPGQNKQWNRFNYEPVYLLEYSGGTFEGNPYHAGFKFYMSKYTYSDIDGALGDDLLYISYTYLGDAHSAGKIMSDGWGDPDEVWGENFTLSQACTINAIEVPVSRRGNPDYDLELYIENSTWSESGVLAEPEEVSGADAPSWYRYTFSTPRTLAPDNYRLFLRVKGWTPYDYYVVPLDNASSPRLDMGQDLSWDGADSYAVYDENYPFENWTSYSGADMPFRLIFENYRSPGVYTSPVLGSGERRRWLNLSWDADVPTGTSMKVEVRRGDMGQPDDPNVGQAYPWSEWEEVQAGQDLDEVFSDNRAASYLQYRITLTANSDNTLAPVVSAVHVRYDRGTGIPLPAPTLKWIQTTAGDLEGGVPENVEKLGGSIKPIKISGGWDTSPANAPVGVGYRGGDTIVAMNGKVYFWVAYGGPAGTDTMGTLTDFYAYDPSTNTWDNTLPVAPWGASYGMGATRVTMPSGENRMYISRGYWTGDPVKLAYYVEGSGWTDLTASMGTVPHLSTMPQDYFRNGLAMEWDHGSPGYIYVLPGAGYDYQEDDWYRYNISSNSWEWMGNVSEDLPDYQGPGNALVFVEGSAAGLSENYLYAMIGRYHYGEAYHGSGPPDHCNFARYGLTSQTWEVLDQCGPDSDHPYGADDGSSLIWDGGDTIWHIPGSYEEYKDYYLNCSSNTEDDYHSDFMIYSISGDVWTEGEKAPYNSRGGIDDHGCAALVGDTIYLLKGGDDVTEGGVEKGGGGVMADNFWKYETPTYYSYGTYTSRASDMEEAVNWGKVTISKSVPTGNSIEVYLSFSDDGSSWSDWMLVSDGQVLDNRSQWIKYKVEFDSSSDVHHPPVFQGIQIEYTLGAATYSWQQDDWSGGSGQLAWSDSTKYYQGENVYVDLGPIVLESQDNRLWGDNFLVDAIQGENLNSEDSRLDLRFRARSTENVEAARIYVKSYGASPTLAVALYADNASNPGYPGDNLTPERTISVDATGWIKANFESPGQVFTDNVYHLVVRLVAGLNEESWVQTDWSGVATTPTYEDGTWDSTYDNYYDNDENIDTSTAGVIKLNYIGEVGSEDSASEAATVVENGTEVGGTSTGNLDADDNTNYYEVDAASSGGGGATNIVINEVAWMGTTSSYSDEWIEFYNPTGSGIDIASWSIYGADTGVVLNFSAADGSNTTIVPAGGYLIYGNDTAVFGSGATVDIWDATIGMDDTGDNLVLYDAPNGTGNIVDQVDDASGAWFAGNSASDITMERIDPAGSGTSSANWANSTASGPATDASANPINGTPGAQNSVYASSTTYSLDVRHDSATVSYTGSLDNVVVTANFKSENTATYYFEIWNYNTSSWESGQSGSVGATEVTWTITKATTPTNYLSNGGAGSDNIRVRIYTTGESSAHRLREDYLLYEVSSSATGAYGSPGILDSSIYDAGENVDWNTISWNATTPTDTSVNVYLRAGNTTPPDASWTSWSELLNGAEITGVRDNNRYVQYRAKLWTNDNQATPEFEDITIDYFVPADEYTWTQTNWQQGPGENVWSAAAENAFDSSENMAVSLENVRLLLASEPEVDDNTMARWRFNEGSGETAYDASTNNNDGTFGPSGSGYDPAWTATAIGGRALDFDGNDYVTVTNDATLNGWGNTYTIEAWVYVRSYPTAFDWGQIVKKGATGVTGDQYRFCINTSGKLVFMGVAGNDWVPELISASAVPTEEWVHVAFTSSATESKLYINGEVENTGDNQYVGTYNTTLYIGAVDGEEGLDGIIDEVALYDRTLSTTEISDHASFGSGTYGNEFRVESTSSLQIDGDNDVVALRFTAQESKYITGVRFYLENVGGSPELKVRLETDSGGEPSGSLVSAGAENQSVQPSGDGWVTANFSAPYPELVAGNVYHIIIRRQAGVDPTWSQTDWSGGSGQVMWSDNTMYYQGENVDVTAVAGQIALTSAGSGSDNAFEAVTVVENGDNLSSPANLDADDGTYYEVDAASSGGGAENIADHIVISEVYIDAGDEYNSEFIELYNPTSSNKTMTDWYFQIGTTQEPNFSGTIPAYGYFLYADGGWSTGRDNLDWPLADIEEEISLTNTDQGIALFDNSTGTAVVVDNFGWGSPGAGEPYEGTPVANPADSGSSYERKAQSSSTAASMRNGDSSSGSAYDTDNNTNDFVYHDNTATKPQPENSASPTEEPPSAAVYSIDVRHDSGTVSYTDTLDNVVVTANFISENTATYYFEIWNWSSSTWELQQSATNTGAAENTLTITATTNPTNYISSNDNIRVRLYTTGESGAHRLREDYLLYEVNYTTTAKTQGYLESSIYDAGSSVQWDIITWNADEPSDTTGENNAVDAEPGTLVDGSSQFGDSGTTSYTNAQSLPPDGSYENISEADNGATSDNYMYVSSYAATKGTVTNFANEQDNADGDAVATLAEREVGGGGGSEENIWTLDFESAGGYTPSITEFSDGGMLMTTIITISPTWMA